MWQPTRRLGPEKEKEVSRQVQDLLNWDLIVLLSWFGKRRRFCVDYRKLNSVTIQDAYPLLRIDDLLDALAGSKFFSTLDLLSRYWQVPLSPDAQDKAAFITRDWLWK